MKTFFRNFFVCFVTLFVLAWFMPNVSLGYPVGVSAFNWSAFILALPIILVAALVLTVLMTLAKPVLKAVFLPVNFVTLGLFNVIINIFLVWLATYLVPGFVVGDLTVFGMQLGQIGGILVFAFMFSLVQAGLLMLF